MPTLSSAAQKVYATALQEAPLGIYEAAQDRYRPIPASIDPVVIDDQLWESVAADCDAIMKALQKLARFLRQPPQRARARLLFEHLDGLEAEAAAGEHDAGDDLATVRFDMFFAQDDLKLLEINTTIPAMQAYGEMVRQAFAAAWVHESKSTPHLSFLDRHSTAQALLDRLMRLAPNKPQHIAVVARAGDAQKAELLYLQKFWHERAGVRVSCVQPEQIRWQDGKLTLDGESVDLIYRHIFASRIDPKSDFAAACRQGAPIFNPITAHLEVKALLAELSTRAAGHPSEPRPSSWTEAECAAIRRRLPWTRLLRAGPSVLPDGSVIEDFLPYLQQKPLQDLVFKTSSGYGGHGVIIGAEWQTADTQARLKEILKLKDAGPVSLQSFLLAASEGPELWVVQERIRGQKRTHSFLQAGVPQEGRDHYFDVSLFGPDFQRAGGVSRFAADPIVNLGKGGGMAPLFLTSEAERLGLPQYRAKVVMTVKPTIKPR